MKTKAQGTAGLASSVVGSRFRCHWRDMHCYVLFQRLAVPSRVDFVALFVPCYAARSSALLSYLARSCALLCYLARLCALLCYVARSCALLHDFSFIIRYTASLVEWEFMKMVQIIDHGDFYN